MSSKDKPDLSHFDSGAPKSGQKSRWALMQRIIAYARSAGLKRITGEVLRENGTMLRMCEALGFTITTDPEDPSIVHVSLALDGAAAARAVA